MVLGQYQEQFPINMKPSNVITKVIISTIQNNPSRLFMEALKHAANGDVLYMSKHVMKELPIDVNLTGVPDKDILRNITFAYLHNWDEVIGKLCLIQTLSSSPYAIIVDGFDEFIEFDSESAVSRPALLCSALLDASGVCAKNTGASCHIVISIDKEVYNSHHRKFNVLLNNYFYGDISTS